MSWVKLDDGYPEHIKVVGLSDAAFRTDVEGWCYCARNLTDGLIPAAIAKRWRKRAITELMDAGRWHHDVAGYRIHDYLDYNPSKADAIARADAKSIAGAKGAAARWHMRNDAPSRPVPQPDPKDAKGKAALSAIFDERPDQDQLYLANRLEEAWDKPLGIPALQKLNTRFGRARVTDAMRQLHGFPPEEAVKSPYAYIAAICELEVSA